MLVNGNASRKESEVRLSRECHTSQELDALIGELIIFIAAKQNTECTMLRDKIFTNYCPICAENQRSPDIKNKK